MPCKNCVYHLTLRSIVGFVVLFAGYEAWTVNFQVQLIAAASNEAWGFLVLFLIGFVWFCNAIWSYERDYFTPVRGLSLITSLSCLFLALLYHRELLEKPEYQRAMLEPQIALLVIGLVFLVLTFTGLGETTMKKQTPQDLLDSAKNPTVRLGMGSWGYWFGTRTLESENEYLDALRANCLKRAGLSFVGYAVDEAEIEAKIAHQTRLKELQELAQTLADQYALKRADSRQKLSITNAAADMALPTKEYAEVTAKIEMDKAELKKMEREAELNLKGAFIYELSEYQQLYLLLDYIKGLYGDAEKSQGQAKAMVEEHIKFMEENFRERQRLLQIDARDNLRGGDEDTEYRGDAEPAI